MKKPREFLGRRRVPVMWVSVTGIVLLVLLVWATRGPAAPSPSLPGTFSFAVLGDAPYYAWEDLQYRVVLQDLQAHELSWVLHVGDILWRPCSEARYRRTAAEFDGLRHPVIYTPGDNEWTDCWQRQPGSYAPLGRLQKLREVFFSDPTRSRGGRALPLASQGGDDAFPEFVENARWEHEGILFATVHLVGSWNALALFPGRTPDDDRAAERRTAAAAAWTRQTFAVARDRGARAVVLGFHANPSLEAAPDNDYRRTYEPFLTALEEEVAAFAGPVLVTQGDDHEYRVDRPLIDRTTGRRLENLTRLQVPGSPRVGWVRVTVRPGSLEPWLFEPRVVPRWKYW